MKTTFAVNVVAAFLLVTSASVAAQPAESEKPDPKVQPTTINISITSRNAGPLFGSVMSGIGRLAKDPRFAAALKRTAPPTPEQTACIAAKGRKDASGRLFDVARCVRAWPEAREAPALQAFARVFQQAVARNGAAALPAVEVEPFDLEQRLQPSQFPPKLVGARFVSGIAGELEPTPAFRAQLCAPNITHIDPAECKVRVVSRLGVYQDDIYVTQLGYRVRLLNPVPAALADEMRSSLLKSLNLPESTPANAVRISIFRKEETGRSLVNREALQTGPLPSDVSKPELPEPGAQIASMWKQLGVDLEKVDLTESGVSAPPPLLVFDTPDLPKPVLITEWLRRFAYKGRLSETCPEGVDDDGHAEAVASELFPSLVLAKTKIVDSVRATPVRTGEVTPFRFPHDTWNGYFLSQRHFKGAPANEGGDPWFHKGLFAATGQPLIGLVVFSAPYERADAHSAFGAATTYLADVSNLLVISAPQRAKVPLAWDFETKAPGPTTDENDLEAMCVARAWPACLGRHPRAVVVASTGSRARSEEKPTLLAPVEYYLGASTVKMAAPGGNIPVVSRCKSSSGNERATSAIVAQNGTSFAAPSVALVLSRLIQIGPEELKVLPEAAVWRMLATTRPLDSGTPPAKPVLFGELDAGRALLGASKTEVGSNGNAMLSERSDKPRPAVIMPYPWNDSPNNIELLQDGKIGLERFTRSVITFSEGRDHKLTLPFKNVLRLVRRPDEQPNGAPLFDIYFIPEESVTAKAPYVAFRERISLGPGNYAEAPGFCRSDGQPQPAQAPRDSQKQAQPACLYAWRAGSESFEPLDLSKVDEVILPPLHIRALFPAGIVPTDIRSVAGNGSPWAKAFCETGPRLKVIPLLQGQPSHRAVCQQARAP